MAAHARSDTDWTRTAELHALIGAWTPVHASRAVRNTRLRVLAELSELKRVTMPPAMPRHSPYAFAGITIRRRPS